MAGHEGARNNLGSIEGKCGNIELDIKHFKIAASAGSVYAMHNLRVFFEQGFVGRESTNSTLEAYNNS